MRRRVSVVVFLVLSLVSVIGCIEFFVTPGKATQLPYPGYPFVSVYPGNKTCTVNETFTVAVIVYNLTDAQVTDPYYPMTNIPLGNLYGFDVQLTWDQTVIHCINYTVTTPFENYSTPIPPSPYAGVLHAPLIKIEDVVNESGNIVPDAPSVRAWFAYAVLPSTVPPPAPMNGNGTICTLTFKVLKKGKSPLTIVYAALADVDGNLIGYSRYSQAWLNPPRSGDISVIGAPSINSVNYWPSIGVVNRLMHFNASVTGNDTDVAKYMWDFGDKSGIANMTTPTADHNYTSSNIYTVTLRVADVDGAESSNFSTSEVKVAASRDLEAKSVILSQSIIRPNRTLIVTTMVNNLDNASFTFYENCTLRLSYNASSLGSNTTWVEVGTGQNASIPNGISGSKQASFSLNSSSLPKLEAYYCFELNVAGIPSEYEANMTNNFKVSSALLYTNTTSHDVSIDTLAFGYQATGTTKLSLPVIEAEDTGISIVVRNAGNDYDQFNVTLYVNSSVITGWNTQVLGSNRSKTFSLSRHFDAGYYNLTVVASGGNVSKSKYGLLTVIKTPSLTIDYSPQSPVVGQEVTINGSRSIHRDPKGNITKYSWKTFAPGVPDSGTSNATFSGSVTNCAFSASGNWTVLLTVTDNYGLTYDPKRTATYAYRKEVVISVLSGPQSGSPLDWTVIGIVVVAVVVIIAAAVILLRRRRGPKPSV